MSLEWLSLNDAEQIFELYCDDFADGWSQKMLCESFSLGRFLALGVKDNQKLVGVITCSVGLFDADIESIYVKKEFRKQGIAYMLMTGLEDRLISQNKEKIFLEVRKSNISAQNLYVKCGFSKVGERKEYYSDLETAVIMAKELKK